MTASNFQLQIKKINKKIPPSPIFEYFCLRTNKFILCGLKQGSCPIQNQHYYVGNYNTMQYFKKAQNISHFDEKPTFEIDKALSIKKTLS